MVSCVSYVPAGCDCDCDWDMRRKEGAPVVFAAAVGGQDISVVCSTCMRNQGCDRRAMTRHTFLAEASTLAVPLIEYLFIAILEDDILVEQ